MGAGCLIGVEGYLLDTVLQGCWLFKQCCILPASHCVAGSTLFKQCQNLPDGQGVAGCLSGIRTYLMGTVLQGCRLFKGSLNLPGGHYVAGVQAV